MKTRMFVACLLFIPSSLFAKVITQVSNTAAGRHQKVINVTIEQVRLNPIRQRGYDFVRPQFEGVESNLGRRGVIGQAEFSVFQKYVYGAPSIKVDVLMTEEIALGAKVYIWPKQPEVLKIPNIKPEFVFDVSLYQKALSTGPRLGEFRLEDAGSVRGTAQSLLSIPLVSYNSENNSLIYIRSFVIHIDNELNNPLTSQVDTGSLIAFVVAKKFENSPSLADYIAHKEDRGFRTTKIIYGKDVNSIQSLRNALKDKLIENLRFAIIIGDSPDIPGKSAQHMSGTTDHYYRAIDTNNYEADINGPDIGLGRISVENEAELEAVLEKYLRYDLGRFSDSAWLNRASWVATSDSGYYRVAEGTHNYVVDQFAIDAAYQGSFPQDPQSGGDKLYAISHRASGTDLLTALKEGRGLVTYSGHGYVGGWAGPNLTSANVWALNNLDSLPFVLGFACNTGTYQGSGGIAEAFQRNPAGAVLYWGSVDSSYWGPDDIVERKLYEGIFQKGLSHFSDILDNALLEHWASSGGSSFGKYYWESYATFADPSMELRLSSVQGVENFRQKNVRRAKLTKGASTVYKQQDKLQMSSK